MSWRASDALEHYDSCPAGVRALLPGSFDQRGPACRGRRWQGFRRAIVEAGERILERFGLEDRRHAERMPEKEASPKRKTS